MVGDLVAKSLIRVLLFCHCRSHLLEYLWSRGSLLRQTSKENYIFLVVKIRRWLIIGQLPLHQWQRYMPETTGRQYLVGW